MQCNHKSAPQSQVGRKLNQRKAQICKTCLQLIHWQRCGTPFSQHSKCLLAMAMQSAMQLRVVFHITHTCILLCWLNGVPHLCQWISVRERERERERESINSNVSCHTEKHGIQVPTLNVSVNNVTYRPAYKVLFVDLAPLEAFNLNWGQFIRLVCASCTAHFNSVSMIKVQTSNMVVYLCLGSQ